MLAIRADLITREAFLKQEYFLIWKRSDYMMMLESLNCFKNTLNQLYGSKIWYDINYLDLLLIKLKWKVITLRSLIQLFFLNWFSMNMYRGRKLIELNQWSSKILLVLILKVISLDFFSIFQDTFHQVFHGFFIESRHNLSEFLVCIILLFTKIKPACSAFDFPETHTSVLRPIPYILNILNNSSCIIPWLWSRQSRTYSRQSFSLFLHQIIDLRRRRSLEVLCLTIFIIKLLRSNLIGKSFYIEKL